MPIILYERKSRAAIEQEAADNIPKLQAWFDANPTRNECHTKVWYGQMVTLHRATWQQDFEAARDAAIKGNDAAGV